MQVDVAILGGALSGSSLALLLRRNHPELRVLVIEKNPAFDRKVGEATTEVSGEFFHRRMNLTHHLMHRHLPKQGLRLWFTGGPDTDFDDTVEIGLNLPSRYPSYQIDRAVFDEFLLESAQEEGACVLRPAMVRSLDPHAPGGGRLVVESDSGEREVRCRWLVDASGRAAVLAKHLSLWESVPEHPTAALWARFRGVADWDGAAVKSKYRRYGSTVFASRAGATNHITGYGWWTWIIPLKGGDFSAGLVFDTRLFAPPAGKTPGERLKAHLLAHPVTREFFGGATPIEGDIKALGRLPYYSRQIAGPGWQLVGDAAGFIDPLYSPGMDFCSWTVRTAFGRISAEARGESVDTDRINRNWLSAYHCWLRGVNRDKYYYIGDAELMSAAYLMDITLFFAGPGRAAILGQGDDDLDCLPFSGPVDHFFGRFMAFYNSRLAWIARKRRAAGCYARRNTGWQELFSGIGPHWQSIPLFLRGLCRWLRAECHALTLPHPGSQGPREGSDRADALAAA